MQVRKFEEELGVELFDRHKHPVELTTQGERIVAQAEIILREYEKLFGLAENLKGAYRGILRVGIIPTIAPYLIPRFLPAFSEFYPEVKVTIIEEKTEEILESLETRKIDVGIVATPEQLSDSENKFLYNEPFVAYVAENHPLYGKKKISVSDLELSQLWLLREGHCFREQALELCQTATPKIAHHPIQVQFESESLDTLRRLIENGIGMTLLPYLSVEQELNAKRNPHIILFKPPVPVRRIHALYFRGNRNIHLIEVFLQKIIDNIPSFLRKEKNSFIISGRSYSEPDGVINEKGE
jgi:LysR family hydrogen peroxide-inducible transcriptional activator